MHQSVVVIGMCSAVPLGEGGREGSWERAAQHELHCLGSVEVGARMSLPACCCNLRSVGSAPACRSVQEGCSTAAVSQRMHSTCCH